MRSVYDAAAQVLLSADPDDKCRAAQDLARDWDAGRLSTQPGKTTPPDRPARPARPVLVSPSKVKRKGLGTEQGRSGLLQAISHIEFNAIDLAADMIARFGRHPLIPEERRIAFAGDWISICADEARHFTLLRGRLAQMGAKYGDMPAHDGLWQAAQATKDDFIARLVIAPMVLEARGLDVTPAMITKLDNAKDFESADILRIIYSEEIGHVATGSRWFKACSPPDEPTQVAIFHEKVRKYFKGLLKPPFNRPARDLAGMPTTFYEPLVPK